MRKKYDIFISYRRLDNSGNTSGRDIARTLKLELEKRGYKIFFDYSEIKDNEFVSTIIPAIRESKYFLLVLSRDALDRCVNDGDWVRREISEAVNSDCKIIPVSPDGQFRSWPDNLPADIRKIKDIQVSDIALGSLFEKSVDKIIEERFSQSCLKIVILPSIVLIIACLAIFIRNSNINLFSWKIIPTSGQISHAIEDNRDIKHVINTFIDSFGGTWCYWGVFSSNDALIPKSVNLEETTGTSKWQNFYMHLDYSAKLFYNGSPYSKDAQNHACVCDISLYGSRSGPDLLYIANLTAMNEPESSFPGMVMGDLGFMKIEEGGFPSFGYELFSKDNQFFALVENSGGAAGLFCYISVTVNRDYFIKYIENTYTLIIK